jgi:hypothetical protein
MRLRNVIAFVVVATLGLPPAGRARSPEIYVMPDSIGVSLVTGQTLEETLQIGNGGRSDLVWSSAVVDRPTAAESNLAGMRVLWDRSHQQNGTATWSSMVAELVDRGATVTENFDPITTGLLAEFDVIWSINSWVAWEDSVRADLADWIQAGGGLVFEGNANVSVTGFNTVLETIGAGIEYSMADGIPGITTDIEPHPITYGVPQLDLGDDAGATLSTVESPAHELVRDSVGNRMIAYSEVGQGRIVTMTVKALHDDNVYSSHNLQYGLQMFQWLGGSQWVTVEPTSGVVPPALTADVTLSFSSLAVDPGTYDAFLWILSNDPDQDSLSVPLHMELVGVPDITVSPDSLPFGSVSVDSSAQQPIQVQNVGLEPLVVDRMDVQVVGGDNPYSLSVTSLYLLPEESGTVVVTFDPASPGDYPATLRIHSNDPDEELVGLPVTGTATGATAALPTSRSPRTLTLDPARPNPFADLTTLRFSIPDASVVRATVHDVEGRLVRELRRGMLEAGEHSVTWDGRNTSGAPAPPGVYFVRLEARGEVKTQKTVVVGN